MYPNLSCRSVLRQATRTPGAGGKNEERRTKKAMSGLGRREPGVHGHGDVTRDFKGQFGLVQLLLALSQAHTRSAFPCETVCEGCRGRVRVRVVRKRGGNLDEAIAEGALGHGLEDEAHLQAVGAVGHAHTQQLNEIRRHFCVVV